MDIYYVNTEADNKGDHEVHKYGCKRLPEEQNRQTLGLFSSCHEAVAKAKHTYSKANGCYHCCYECHTS